MPDDSSEQQREPSTTDATPGMTSVSISMPGLQPFAKGSTVLPCSWSNCTLSGDVPFCVVRLPNQSWEFQSILTEFTAAGLTVMTIERIENRDLWEKFQFEKQRMQKKRSGGLRLREERGYIDEEIQRKGLKGLCTTCKMSVNASILR